MSKHSFNPTGNFLLVTENFGPGSEEFIGLNILLGI